MKFKCDRQKLNKAVENVQKAVSSKSNIPALEGILLKAENKKITLCGYDLDIGITTSIDADIYKEGSIVVTAKLFSDIIKRMPEDTISIESDEKLIIYISGGKTDYKIIGMSAEEYPELPITTASEKISIDGKTLKSMIRQTIYAVSDKDENPTQKGSLFEISDNTLKIVSVDGYRLAKRTEQISGGKMDSCSFVVPGYALSDIVKICEDDEKKTAAISVGAKHISFNIGETVVITRRLEGEFLNYRKSLPEKFMHIVEVEKTSMMSTIDRVSLIISEKNTNPVRMTFEDGRIECLCVTPIGKAEDVCLCDGTADGMTIGFNDRYFMEALKASGKDKLQICLNTPSSPAIIRAADGTENFTYMILPVRLKAGD